MNQMSPGWVDLQVNGYKGVDFSNPTLSLEDIKTVSIELLKQGTVGYCPTLITSPINVYEHNLPLIAEASESKEGAQILGIHLEGPFINPEYGPRGIHPEKHVLLPSIELYERFRSLAQDKIALLTLAPERPGGLELIEHIVNSSSTVVSIGHLAASNEIIQKAVKAGARAATHVGNGLPDLIHRHKNPLWPLLAEDRLTGLFITDGSHLSDQEIRTFLRAKRVSNFIVTSDVVHLAGMDPGEYLFHGIPVILESNGYLHRKNATQHAGSTSTMADCVGYMAGLNILNEEELKKVGFENPLKLLNAKIDQKLLESIEGK